LTISVRDTGLGISPEEQVLIFDEFRQSERTTARGYGGLGLGLAICKLLVEMHQGTIGVHSTGEEGRGAEFYFTLPVMERDATGESDTAACDHVLLLTEDVTQGQRLEEHLAYKGVDIVMHAVDAETDWRTLLCGGAPDAVILDQAVTAAHGWNILRTLKEYPHTRDVPVLCYTLSGDGGKGALLPLDFMMKPLGKTQLAEMLLGQGLLDPQGDAPEARKILIVDDDPNILAMHTRMVQAQSPHYYVLQAHNGREALDILQREQPDLVLLDLMMPELDGFGVLEAMRENPLTQRIPVVILTAQVLTEDDMARLNRGMVSILSKGLFSTEETLQHIETMLARRRKTVLEVQRLVHKAMAYIHTNYMRSLTRSDIASHVGLSERHLTRCFQQEMGVTPITYLNRYRIQQAKILLEAGDMAITEVAMAVGFSSGGYFTRVFRQEMGVSPREFQSGEKTSS
jgi:CheY-like chemotaxis protein